MFCTEFMKLSSAGYSTKQYNQTYKTSCICIVWVWTNNYTHSLRENKQNHDLTIQVFNKNRSECPTSN